MKIKSLMLGCAFVVGSICQANAADDGCNQTVREPNSTVKKYNLQSSSNYNYQLDIWRLQCDDSMQVLVKVYPKAGKTRAVTSSYYGDYMYIYQNGKQVTSWDMWDGKRLVTHEEPLFVQGIWRYNDTRFDFEMKRTVEAKVNNAGSVLLSGETTMTTGKGLSNVSGTWYDPTYDGSGFNVSEIGSGLVVTFYGYKSNASGQAQWLLSSTGPGNVNKGEKIILELYQPTVGNGANFTTKPNTAASLSKWGSATLTFNSCNTGVITMDGKDGKVTHNIIRISGVKGVTCTE